MAFTGFDEDVHKSHDDDACNIASVELAQVTSGDGLSHSLAATIDGGKKSVTVSDSTGSGAAFAGGLVMTVTFTDECDVQLFYRL